MEHTLMHPNQLRTNGVIVNDVPVHLAPDPSKATHSIYIVKDDLVILLTLKGMISTSPTRWPSTREIEIFKFITLTSNEEWLPDSDLFLKKEWQWQLSNDSIDAWDRNTFSINTEVQDEPVDEGLFDLQLSPTVKVSAFTNTNKVAKTFGIGLETASITLKATIQLAIRQSIHPIHKRYSTKVAQLQYPRISGLHGKYHTDTFFSHSNSLSRCTMGQLYHATERSSRR